MADITTRKQNSVDGMLLQLENKMALVEDITTRKQNKIANVTTRKTKWR